MRAYEQSGYKYKETPIIMLKGMWLKKLGFDIGDYVSTICENGKLIITPDTETAAMKAAEEEFMEREVKKPCESVMRLRKLRSALRW